MIVCFCMFALRLLVSRYFVWLVDLLAVWIALVWVGGYVWICLSFIWFDFGWLWEFVVLLGWELCGFGLRLNCVFRLHYVVLSCGLLLWCLIWFLLFWFDLFVGFLVLVGFDMLWLWFTCFVFWSVNMLCYDGIVV